MLDGVASTSAQSYWEMRDCNREPGLVGSIEEFSPVDFSSMKDLIGSSGYYPAPRITARKEGKEIDSIDNALAKIRNLRSRQE